MAARRRSPAKKKTAAKRAKSAKGARGAKGAKSAKGANAAKGAKRAPSPIDRLRQICLAMPEAHEVAAWGEPTFRVKNKIFAMHASASSHHGGGRPAVWILSVNSEQDFVLRARPDRYFKPPYVGPSGWIGAWLDRNPPWSEIAELLKDGYRRRAPKKLAALV